MNYMRKARRKRVKTEVYEFIWRRRENYLPVFTRYIRTYCFYEIEMF